MNASRCCHDHPSAPRLHRARSIAGWLVPGTALALLPKCPMCVAAYVALGTGIVITPASASLLLRATTAACIGALAFCVARRLFKHHLH